MLEFNRLDDATPATTYILSSSKMKLSHLGSFSNVRLLESTQHRLAADTLYRQDKKSWYASGIKCTLLDATLAVGVAPKDLTAAIAGVSWLRRSFLNPFQNLW